MSNEFLVPTIQLKHTYRYFYNCTVCLDNTTRLLLTLLDMLGMIRYDRMYVYTVYL